MIPEAPPARGPAAPRAPRPAAPRRRPRRVRRRSRTVAFPPRPAPSPYGGAARRRGRRPCLGGPGAGSCRYPGAGRRPGTTTARSSTSTTTPGGPAGSIPGTGGRPGRGGRGDPPAERGGGCCPGDPAERRRPRRGVVGRGAWGVAGLGAGTGPGKEAWGALPEPGCVSRPGALEGPVGAAPSRAPFAHPFPDALQNL